MALSFSVNDTDRALISKIADRARDMDIKHNGKDAAGIRCWQMDITATHASGNPLRLADLLAADDFNFAHDVFGIAQCINRDTGELMNFFSPRFSAPVEVSA